MSISHNLCTEIKNLSGWTWEQLDKAVDVDMHLSEESLSDFLFLKLKELMNQKSNFTIKTFTKAKEAINGADWEFWFVNREKTKFLGIRIQAKVIYTRSNNQTYNALHYIRKTKKSAPIPQIDFLENSSKKDKVTPLYCMYTHIRKNSKVIFTNQKNFNQMDFGLSLITTTDVRKHKANNEKRLKYIETDFFPLCSIFCYHSKPSFYVLNNKTPSKTSHNLDLPSAVFETLKEKKIDGFLLTVEELPDYLGNILKSANQTPKFNMKNRIMPKRGIIFFDLE